MSEYDKDIAEQDAKYKKMKQDYDSGNYIDAQWALEDLNYQATLCSIARKAKRLGW